MEAVLLTDELLEWLLDPADPALRAKVLVDLLDHSEDDPEVREARERIPEQPWVKATLAAFTSGRVWKERFYQKYCGPSWSLSHLAEIGLPADHPVMQSGVEFILENVKQLSGLKPDGKSGKLYGERSGCYWMHPIACLSARMSTVLSRAGLHDHPAAVGAREGCLHLFDPENGMRCTAMELSLLPACMMTVPEVMKAMLAVPEADRTVEEREFLRDATALLKRHHLYRYVPIHSKQWVEETAGKSAAVVRREKEAWLAAGRSEPRKEKAGWLKFSFPHSYNPDLLEVLLVLGGAGAEYDDVIEEGIERVLDARDSSGRWVMVGGLNGKMWADLDTKGMPSPWITYRALKALTLFGMLQSVS